MRPDQRRPRPSVDDGAAGRLDLPADVELAALEDELAAAGARARRGAPASPTAAFRGSLRARLIGAYERSEPGGLAPAVAAGGSLSTQARGFDGSARRPVAMVAEPVVHAPIALQARTLRLAPSFLPSPRWSILAVAAAVVVAVVGLNGGLVRPVPAESRVASATGATLIRAGQTLDLTAGTALATGDEIRIADGGSAVLQLGDSRTRLAAGADLRLSALARDDIELQQLAGRAWHRVVLPEGGRYEVTTGEIHWTAVGTAFDIERTTGPAGDVVHELSIEHAVRGAGPGLLVTIPQGDGATVVLGATPMVDTTVVPEGVALADPWLRANAAADLADGFRIGMFDRADLAPTEPAASPSEAVPTPEPTASPTPSVEPTLAPTAAPTRRPAVKPTPRPTAMPTPVPTLGAISLSTLACPGAIELGWSLPELATLDHVQVLRGSSAEIPVTWPPAAGVTAFDGGYVVGGSVRNAFDASLGGGAHAWYRAVAFDAAKTPLAASGVTDATMIGIGGLGALGVSDGGAAGTLQFTWAPFAGSGDCFSFYKLVASADDPTPSYLTGATYLAVLTEQAAAATTVSGLTSGQALWFRLQAIREFGPGKFVAAQTDPVEFTVP